MRFNKTKVLMKLSDDILELFDIQGSLSRGDLQGIIEGTILVAYQEGRTQATKEAYDLVKGSKDND